MPSDIKLRVLIAAEERSIRDQIRQYLLDQGNFEIAGTAVDGQEAVQLTMLLRPDVALIKADLPIFSGFEASEMIGLAAPEVCRIILGDGTPDTQTWQKAMTSGVRAYVPSPYSDDQLRQALAGVVSAPNRLSAPEFINATDPTLLPKVVTVTGGKGGIGKTTIAVSLATCLAEKHPGKVILCDFYTQFGDVSTMLDITPRKSLSDLTQTTDQIDLDMLEGYMIDQDGGLKILIASTKSQPIDAISVSDAESIIHSLKRAYTHIIIDLPPILHPTTLYVLSHCYQMLLVTNLFDMPTVRDAKELYDTVAGTYMLEDRISLVANRVSKCDRLTLADLERLFGRKVDVQIPNDRRLVSSINQGVPFVKAYARSPLVAAIHQIIDKLDGTNSTVSGLKQGSRR